MRLLTSSRVRIAVASALAVLLVVPAALAADTAAASADKGRLYFSGAALGASVGEADVQSDNVRDYTFSSAPTDWVARSGEWNATNRWTCSPQWSWYGGYSPNGVAALWNKRQFMGDVTVELYSAFKMRLNRDPTYLHPNDINITICGDGQNLDSGYAFIIGGDENRWTRIMRGERVIAETRDPAALWPIYENGQPSTYEWHRKWWSVRVRKSGAKLQVYLDEKLVLEGTDPNPPLPGGRVALWVLKNDLITPRVKIYYEKEKSPRDPMPVAASVLAARGVVAEPQITLSSSTHPAVQNDFENDLGRFSTRDGDQGAVCDLIPGGPAGEGSCLKLTNRAAGGSFGANIVDQRFDARQLPELSFDYRLTPDVKANFYLTCGEKRWELVFSGVKEASPGCELLGEIPGVVADEKWHHASFDLLGALQRMQGLEAPVICSDLWVGNASNKDYLLAGFCGNHAGATWYLDNFLLAQPRGSALELAIAPKPGVEVEGYAVSMDDKALGTAPQRVTTKDNTFKAELPAEGATYVHVRPLLKGGNWGANVNYVAAADKAAPQVAATRPAAGGPLADGPVALTIRDPGGSALDLNSLKLTLGPKALTASSPGVTYDAAQSVLLVDPRAAGLVLSDGEKVALAVTAMADRAGNALAAPQSYTFGMDFKSYKATLPAPKVQVGAGYFCDDDFESGLGQWASWGQSGGAVLTRDNTTAASGEYSLKLYNPRAGAKFGAYVTQTPFDAGKYRIISFAYQCDDRLRADLAVYVNGDWKGIKFTDNDNDLGVIGEVPKVQADGKWHTASLDLYDLLRKDDPVSPTFIVRMFVIADWGWAGNRPGATFHLDDFQIIPVTSAAQPVRVAWNVADAAGLAGASWVLDSQPATDAPTKLSGPGTEAAIDCGALTDGWLHLRAQDRAGNWSATTSRRLLVDSQSPTASAAAPAGGKSAVSEVVLRLADQGLAGVDPSSVRLKVGGTDYVTDGASLRYVPAESKLVWNCEQVLPSPVVFPDGKQVDVQLVAAADYAGNAVQQLPSWNWTMDYSQDKTPPRVSDIQSTTHPTFVTQTFEDGDPQWINRDGQNGAAVSIDKTTAASGSCSVKLTNQVAGGHMQACISRTAYDCEKYPVVSFDYRLPAETKLALSAYFHGKWYAITLNDAATDVVGRVPGIIADDKWRHASVDLTPLLRRQEPNGSLVVDYLIIGDRNTMDNAAGACAWFDNLSIGMVGKYPPVLRWRATDTTGVKGFSYVLDQDASTVPDETSEGTEVAKSFDAMKAGLWWFHIRAQDGAGNWGPPTTYELMHLKSE